MERTTDQGQEYNLPDIGIPSEILFNPNLTASEKILYGFIRNLSQTEKGCFATNKHLAELMGYKSNRTISRELGNLEDNHIVYIQYNDEKKKSVRLSITINPNYKNIYTNVLSEKGEAFVSKGRTILSRGCIKNVYPGVPKMSKGVRQNCLTEVVIEDVNEEERKINKKKKSFSQKIKEEVFNNLPSEWKDDQKFLDSLNNYFIHRKQKQNSSLTKIAAKKMAMKLSKHTVDIAIAALDSSVENGWTGVFPESVNNNRQKQTIGSGSRKFGVKSKYREPDKIIRKPEPHEDTGVMA